MPASGKSYWAEKLSNELNIPFLDLDNAIVENENRSIEEIFREDGEAKFREIETSNLERIIKTKSLTILSLGGGTPCSDYNLSLLKENSFSIYLNASIDSIYVNLLKDDIPRPKFQNSVNLKLDLKNLLAERDYYYKRADRIIDEPFSLHTLLKVLPAYFKN